MTSEPTPLGEPIAVDFEATKAPEPCSYCPSWRFQYVDLPEGGSALREWHLVDCPNTSWLN